MGHGRPNSLSVMGLPSDFPVLWTVVRRAWGVVCLGSLGLLLLLDCEYICALV